MKGGESHRHPLPGGLRLTDAPSGGRLYDLDVLVVTSRHERKKVKERRAPEAENIGAGVIVSRGHDEVVHLAGQPPPDAFDVEEKEADEVKSDQPHTRAGVVDNEAACVEGVVGARTLPPERGAGKIHRCPGRDGDLSASRGERSRRDLKALLPHYGDPRGSRGTTYEDRHERQDRDGASMMPRPPVHPE